MVEVAKKKKCFEINDIFVKPLSGSGVRVCLCGVGRGGGGGLDKKKFLVMTTFSRIKTRFPSDLEPKYTIRKSI